MPRIKTDITNDIWEQPSHYLPTLDIEQVEGETYHASWVREFFTSNGRLQEVAKTLYRAAESLTHSMVSDPELWGSEEQVDLGFAHVYALSCAMTVFNKGIELQKIEDGEEYALDAISVPSIRTNGMTRELFNEHFPALSDQSDRKCNVFNKAIKRVAHTLAELDNLHKSIQQELIEYGGQYKGAYETPFAMAYTDRGCVELDITQIREEEAMKVVDEGARIIYYLRLFFLQAWSRGDYYKRVLDFLDEPHAPKLWCGWLEDLFSNIDKERLELFLDEMHERFPNVYSWIIAKSRSPYVSYVEFDIKDGSVTSIYEETKMGNIDTFAAMFVEFTRCFINFANGTNHPTYTIDIRTSNAVYSLENLVHINLLRTKFERTNISIHYNKKKGFYLILDSRVEMYRYSI